MYSKYRNIDTYYSSMPSTSTELGQEAQQPAQKLNSANGTTVKIEVDWEIEPNTGHFPQADMYRESEIKTDDEIEIIPIIDEDETIVTKYEPGEHIIIY